MVQSQYNDKFKRVDPVTQTAPDQAGVNKPGRIFLGMGFPNSFSPPPAKCGPLLGCAIGWGITGNESDMGNTYRRVGRVVRQVKLLQFVRQAACDLFFSAEAFHLLVP